MSRVLARLKKEDRGAATAEYLITIMAGVAIAGTLVVIFRGDDVTSLITDLVHRALSVPG
jgi:Flp pilus assembly pilin Flp